MKIPTTTTYATHRVVENVAGRIHNSRMRKFFCLAERRINSPLTDEIFKALTHSTESFFNKTSQHQFLNNQDENTNREYVDAFENIDTKNGE